MFKMGIDVGSTTLKYVILDDDNNILQSGYERHFSQISQKMREMLKEAQSVLKVNEVALSISGSAGMGISEQLGIPFVQEVYATRLAVKTFLPETTTVIELGGEDAKILFLSGTMEVRMNGSCAGGTGAFIDQMATLLHITPTQMNALAQDAQKIYTIASRCGVFAKTDIQPLLNQGAQKEDISASIFAAVANQTISGLAQGRKIEGNVLYLGGPLTFFSELRESFDKALKINGVFAPNSLHFVSLGTALSKDSKVFSLNKLLTMFSEIRANQDFLGCDALFSSKQDFEDFAKRHKIGEQIPTYPLKGKAYIGVDAGSTTLKAVLVGEDENVVHYKYRTNGGTPVPLVREFLQEVYEKYPNIEIGAVATTGYGEEIVKEAFKADFGIVETIAHFTGAQKFEPNVDFIIDIGGQDIKCFKIRNNAIDNIFLNEACSSGCGSFLQTFATALGEQTEEFSAKGLFAKKPVDLGSRCTVFMNSSVKQAQKDGVGIEDISAGLSISVVKNALYKVIRVADPKHLGEHIVVQGGTFLNNAVLRAFEQVVGTQVTRPQIAGLMGAYGAALYAKANNKESKSTILTQQELNNFVHTVKASTCGLCQNRCKLTINTFADGHRYIAGNRCERPLKRAVNSQHYNLFDYKKELLANFANTEGKRGTIGLPLVLNIYEMLPFWHTFYKELGFGVKVTKESTRKTYLKGQQSIPSDTVCYPAKLVHGHIEDLLEQKVDSIFYPCMSYNFDEGMGDNHYNCPVVAYYPEVIDANITEMGNTRFIKEYVGVHRKKDFAKKMHAILNHYFKDISRKEVAKAAEKAYTAYDMYRLQVEIKGTEYLKIAKQNKLPIIILTGRPYHLDSEVNHGIDKLICEQGAVLITEEAVCKSVERFETNVLNQWTYHSRLYAAAKYVASSNYENINLVQLVSFGCGVDSITTDEVRHILEQAGKICTQLKIDEINNLGAVKIRLRSLFAATGVQSA